MKEYHSNFEYLSAHMGQNVILENHIQLMHINTNKYLGSQTDQMIAGNLKKQENGGEGGGDDLHSS